MPYLRSFRPVAVLITISLSFGVATVIHAASTSMADFTGIWRLDDQHSDSPSDIATRLHLEEKAEKPAQLSTGAATGTSSSGPSANHKGGRGGHGGGLGGGHGRGGNHSQNKTDDSDGNGAPKADDPPPLLAEDSIMNVQQDTKAIHVVFDGKDQLDGRLDGIVRQSLNGNAMVQSQLGADGLEISMQFDGEVRLLQRWARSTDGHHLIVTESWTTPAVKQPIVFKRTYDRLDI
ncbi:hypothetical protein [Rhodanobacter sp. L36]|uniref:hypothetical protein n=1 Tax=Rhodanobacter sp. L36 TaxID=1747221 RepID=UPI00131E02BF|nr:hypothetical protein [Rhodanobacter sp. L36]